MVKKKLSTQAEQSEETKTNLTSGVSQEQEQKQIKIREILESDLPIATYLKCDHGLILKQIFGRFGSLEAINSYINMLCLASFPERKKPEHGFNIVMDHEFFCEKGKEKERVVGFIKDVLESDDKQIFLVGPVTIDFLTEMTLKFKLSNKSEEEIKSILSSKITTMQRDQLQKAAYKVEAFQSINIYTGKNDMAKGLIQNKLLQIDCTKLKDANFVLAELEEENRNDIGDFKGIEKAFDIYTRSPDKKLILMSTMPFEEFKDKKSDNTKLEFLLNQKNFRFLYLFDQEAFDNFKKETGFDFDSDIPAGLQPRPITTFDAKILENLFEPDYLSTIALKLGIGNEELEKDFINQLREVEHPELLKDLMIVQLFAKHQQGQALQDAGGLDVIRDEIQQNPDRRIIAYSPMNIETLKIASKKSNQEHKFEILLSKKNIKFMESPFRIKDIQSAFSDSQGDDKEQTNVEVAFQKLMGSEISHFLHDSKYWIDRDKQENIVYEKQLEYFFFEYDGEKTPKRLEFENKLISLLQIQHGSFKLLTRKDNLQGIIDIYKYSRAQLLPEGTRFEGLFIDRDGTLYDNKKQQFNQKIIDMIKDYESQGKNITIRTGGNIEMKQKLLDEIGLNYKIKSKTDYKGGTVEIAIDNDSQEFLFANARIKSEKHIKV